MELNKRALLSDCSIRQAKRTTTDKLATEQTARDRKARPEAVKVVKKIWGPMYAPVEAAANRIRARHDSLTSPWMDGGMRILSTKAFDHYTKAMREAREDFEEEVEKFLKKYNEAREQAKQQLGELFSEDDYPDIHSMASKFSVDIRFFPIPDAGDWRVELDQQQMDILKQQVAQQQQDIASSAVHGTVEKLYDTLCNFAEKVASAKVSEATLKSLEKTLDELDLLDIDTSGQTAELIKNVKKLVYKQDAEMLREDDVLADKIVDEADGIADKLAAYMDAF